MQHSLYSYYHVVHLKIYEGRPCVKCSYYKKQKNREGERKSLEATVKLKAVFMVTVLQKYTFLQTHQNAHIKNIFLCM